MRQRSQAVDKAIRLSYAVLANELFKLAKERARAGGCSGSSGADAAMGYVEDWLEKAGAEATKWSFNT